MFEWGWVVEPDPNYQLSTFTCANRSYKDGGTIYANLSDSLLLQPGLRRALRPAERRDRRRPSAPRSSSRCSRCSTTTRRTSSPYYYDNLEAYRSDRFTGFVPQPDPNGALLFQYGTWSYRERQAGQRPTTSRRAARPAARRSTVGADRGRRVVALRRGLVLGVVLDAAAATVDDDRE